jgi:hypothetical protein
MRNKGPSACAELRAQGAGLRAQGAGKKEVRGMRYAVCGKRPAIIEVCRITVWI